MLGPVSGWHRYLVAIIATVCATLPCLALHPLLSATPSMLFVGAVAISAWYGGVGPGVLAMMLSSVVFDYLFVGSPYSLDIDSAESWLALIGFVSVNLLIIFLTASLRREVVTRRAEAQARAELLARERDASRELHVAHDALQDHTTALAESEERYRRLVEHMPDAIVVYQDARLVFVNQAAVHMAGATSPSDLIGRPILEFVHPDDQALVRIRGEAIGAGEAGVATLAERLVRIDGTVLEVELTSIPIVYAGGPAAQAVIRDVTERRRADAALRQSEVQFRMLHDVAMATAGVLDRSALAQLVVDQACDVLQVPGVMLAWWVPEAQTLRVLAHRGAADIDRGRIYRVDEGLIGAIFRERKPIVVDDYANSPVSTDEGVQRGLRTVAGVPVVVHDRAVGVLAVRGAGPGTFTDQRMQLLSLLAAQVGPSLAAAQLYGESEERRQEAEALAELARQCSRPPEPARVIDLVLDLTTSLLSADYTSVALVDPDGSLRIRGTRGYRNAPHLPSRASSGQGPLSRAVASGQTILVEHLGEQPAEELDGFRIDYAEGGQTVLTTPLRSREHILGALAVAWRSPVTPSTPEIRLAETLAGFAAAIIDNAVTQAQSHLLSAQLAQQAGQLADRNRELQEAQAELLRAQRLETAGRVAGQVAHDFNNLLSPLVGFAELIKAKLPPGDPAAAYCDVMTLAAQQMVDINEDLLTLGRRGHVELEPVDLNNLVRQSMLEREQSTTGITFTTQLAPDLPPVLGSAGQLLRVVTNLVNNACEAMEEGGELTITTDHTYQDEPLVSYTRVPIGEYVRLTVRDTGPGISAEIRDRIFDAFFTTHQSTRRRGSGLGLTVVRSVVDDHHGYVDLESQVGVGTTFVVYLPVARKPATLATAEPLRGGTESLLVVDDDPLQRDVATEVLRSLGYCVTVAASGEEALAYLADHPADLLILDMVMPGGMDGAETFRAARVQRPGQRAIILSGFADSERVTMAQEAGAGTFVRKPIARDRLARAVRAELDKE